MPKGGIDLSEIEAMNGHVGGKCLTGALLRGDEPGLSDNERKTLEAALTSHHQSTAIAKWLRTKGVRIAPQTLGRHRNGNCLCD
jgi:hypothetical protein